MARLTFSPVFGSYLLVVGAALLLLVLWALVGPGRDRIHRVRRMVLAVLRGAVIALVLLALLRPTLVYTQTKRQSATVLLLMDKSRSMSVPDAIGGKPRWEALRRSVDDAADALARLTDDFELRAYTFDAEPHPVEHQRGRIALDTPPDGQQTAIGAVLEDVLAQEAGKRLLGVILMSDGAQRAYAPRDLAPQTAASRLKPMGTPLYTFPLGQSRGLGQAQDVAVKDLLVNQDVFVKNELAISGQVRVDGYVHREIPVRVLFETSPGKMEKVAEQTLKITTDGQLLPLHFSYAPQVPGEYKLTLEAVEQPDELATTNNRLSTFVNVLKGGLNVLYLEGVWRSEARFLQESLNASPDINVVYHRIDPTQPETRPGDLPEQFRPGRYDVYILGDLDSTALRGNELADLAEAVRQGAGLVMLGGFRSFGPGGYASTPLAEVLPIEMDRTERQRLEDPPRPDVHVPGPLGIRPTRLGLMHFSLMLAGSREENSALWAKLPPLQGANRFSLSHLAPGAMVLAEAGPSVPLLVVHTYGSGRVMAFGVDSTWRWWMHGYEDVHKRFWRQMILWLAKKDQATDGNVWVRLAKRRFAPSERVELTTGAKSATGEPVLDAEFKAEIVMPDGKRRPLALVRQDQQMEGSFRENSTAGDYAIEVTAIQNAAPLGTARARFLVFEQDLELDNAAADAASMESLAAMTGGESLAPEQLPELIDRLSKNTASLEVQQETKEPFWDTWPFFLSLVGLLGIEWYLRKRWGLV